MDRNSSCPAIVASKNGGMDIEEVAKTDPKSIVVELIDPEKGLSDQNLNNVVSKLELSHIGD